MISKVLKGQNETKGVKRQETVTKAQATELPLISQDHVCKGKCGNIDETNITDIISKVIKESKNKGKVVVKVEIKLHNE